MDREVSADQLLFNPESRVSHCLFEHELTELADRPRLFSDRHKVEWVDSSPCRVVPTHESFCPDGGLCDRGEHWLVVEREALFCDCLRKGGGELSALAGLGPHLGGEEHASTSTAALGFVHGSVGIADQRGCCICITQIEQVGISQGHADTDREVQIKLVDAQPPRECSPDSLGYFESGDGIRDVRTYNEELVATDTGNVIFGPDRVGQSIGGRDEKPIADLVAERIVDVLQPIDVDKYSSNMPRMVSLGTHGMSEGCQYLPSVGQPC